MPFNPNQAIDSGATVAKEAVAAGKGFWKSKTFWANVVLAGSAYVGYLPADIAPYVVVGVNLILRYLTTGPISVTGK